jgi:hypothetical protein
LIKTLFFEKNANFCRKSQKIVIICNIGPRKLAKSQNIVIITCTPGRSVWDRSEFRGRCDHYFLLFLTIFGPKKLTLLSKTNVIILLALFWVKDANLFADNFFKNHISSWILNRYIKWWIDSTSNCDTQILTSQFLLFFWKHGEGINCFKNHIILGFDIK